jgi:hypothetical protein
LYQAGKTYKEIKAYSEAFWKNYKKIDNYRKYLERIEKGEADLALRRSIDQAIHDKFVQLENDFLDESSQKELSDFSIHDIIIKYPEGQRPNEKDPFAFSELED